MRASRLMRPTARVSFGGSSRRCVKGKLFHYTVDNSSLRRRIRLKSFHEATKKSQKLGDNHIHGRGFFVSELSQPLALDDFIALSNHGIRNIFSNNDFGQIGRASCRERV